MPSVKLRRWWHRRQLKDHKNILYQYMTSSLPNGNTPWRQVRFLAVDIETTDLEPEKGEIVSIGWVPMVEGKIQLAEARHIYVSIRREVGQSAVFHQIGDDQLHNGIKASEMFEQFLAQAMGSVIVFHNAQMDMAFLNKLSRRLYGSPMISMIADTLVWEKNKIYGRYQHIPTDSLRLHNSRRRYHLPDYPAHDALTDALATLELLMAQIKYLGESAKLKDILDKSSPW